MIYRQTHQANFSIRANSLLQDNTLSDPAYRLLNHLLSLPADWQVYPKQLMKYFNWSKDKTYNALKELRKHGYAVLIRCRRSSIWKIYENPLVGQSDESPCAEIVDEPSNTEPSKIPCAKNSYTTDTLQSNKISLTKKKNTTTAPDPIEPKKETVVVPFEIEQPIVTTPDTVIEQKEVTPAITPDPLIVAEVEKLPVTEKIKPGLVKTFAALTLVEAKAVLVILTHALVAGKVQNPVGYAVELSKRAINGTLTPIEANYQPTLSERLAKQEADRKREAERGRMTNAEWAAWFEKTHKIRPKI